MQRGCLIAGILGFGFTAMFIMVFGLAMFGVGGGQGEAGSGSQGGTAVASAAGSGRWTVVKLPDDPKGTNWKVHYTDQEFEELRQTMQDVVDEHKLPADEFMGLIDVESGHGNPNACSSVGARGLGQFMPNTARDFPEFGETVEERENIENLCNPIKSLRAAARKLATDRRCWGGADWSTLKTAYLGKDGSTKCLSYNPGLPDDSNVWTEITKRGDNFERLGYVVQLSEFQQMASGSDIPAYSQYDPAWKDLPYGSSGTIGTSGCGPTAAAMVLRFYGKDVTPKIVADLSVEWGYRIPGCGTDWDLFPRLSQHFELKYERLENISEVKEWLGRGKPVIVSGRGPRPFTNGGHFIVLTSYDATTDTFMVQDPADQLGNKRSGHYPVSLIEKYRKPGSLHLLYR